MVVQLGRTPVWGTGDRRFDSGSPDWKHKWGWFPRRPGKPVSPSELLVQLQVPPLEGTARGGNWA